MREYAGELLESATPHYVQTGPRVSMNQIGGETHIAEISGEGQPDASTKILDADKIIGQNITHFRRRRKITQQELANRTEIEKRILSRIEQGNAVISMRVLDKIAAGLQIEVKELYEGAYLP